MRFAIAIAAALALAGCQTTPQIDAAIQKALPGACASLNMAYSAFKPFADNGVASETTVARVETAYAGVRILCADPANVTAIDAFGRVAAATAIIIAVNRSMKR